MRCVECDGEIAELLQVGEIVYAVCDGCLVAHRHRRTDNIQSPTEAAEAIVRLSELRVAGTRFTGLTVREDGGLNLQVELGQEVREALARDRRAAQRILTGERAVSDEERGLEEKLRERAASAETIPERVDALLLTRGAAARVAADLLRQHREGAWYAEADLERARNLLAGLGISRLQAEALLADTGGDRGAA